MKRFVLTVLLLGLATSLLAQTPETDLQKLPGYVDFDRLAHFKNAKENVEVYLKEPLLSLIAAAADSELAGVLANLKMIRVQSYSLPRPELRHLQETFGKVGKKLEAQGWYLVVSVKDTSDWTHIYMKNAGKRIAGMVVVTADRSSGEITFVNLVGSVDLAALSRLSGQFSIPQLDSIRSSKPGSGGRK
ncbi:MAG TPA: DUF4252 domain-containing protein [Bacteroidetes bacterium]|nr:DUF4252 domain-containing protein [Bacteroidota bacterium]